jgi:Ser/Thr protein kinase RdoA (MazF antagonist)
MTFLTVAGADGLREFSVYPQIEGSTLTNTSHPRETGATLAAFHLACEGYQGPKSVRIRDIDAIVHRSTSHIAQCAYLDDSIKSACLRTAKRLEDKLRALHLTTGHCHHDWDKNVIGTVGLRGSISQITIIDFDTVGPGVLASDFVNLFADFHPTTRAPTNDQPDPQWKILLQGYCEKKPLHKDDISSIPIFSAFATIRSLNRRILEIDTYGLAALLNFPEQWQKRADYLEGVKPM